MSPDTALDLLQAAAAEMEEDSEVWLNIFFDSDENIFMKDSKIFISLYKKTTINYIYVNDIYN